LRNSIAENQFSVVSKLIPHSEPKTENWELRTGFRYHFSVQELADQLRKTIRKQESIRPGDRVAAAVSGGADSVALLCLLLELRAELGIVLSVAHVNHKLRGQESDGDERFVAQLAQRHGLELHAWDAPIEARHTSEIRSEDSSEAISKAGSELGSGIEADARKLRYGFFRQLARDGRVSKIATAHTLDDQAETVLLRIFRGTGIRGLSSIHPRIVFEEKGRALGELVRPLLGVRRAALLEFLRERGQSWREDSSNRDIAFLRNRVRHRLLPLLREVIGQEFGEAAIEHMAELAEIARAEEEHWKCGHPEVAPPLPRAAKQAAEKPSFVSGYRFSDTVVSVKSDAPLGAAVPQELQQAASLPLGPLLALPLASQRRLVRAWLEANASDSSISFRLIEEVLELARGAAGRKLELPGGRDFPRRNLRRGRQELLLESEPVSSPGEARRQQLVDYEYALTVPGAVEVHELAACIEARVVNVTEVPEHEHAHLLDMQRMPKQVLIRNWRAGDRYWPAHTAAARKVKELLSDRHLAGPQKKLWPVAVANGCGLVWMRGFAVPAAFHAPANAAQAIWIRETAGMM
jgi:tRNA(Ile)-lysidine synthase